MRERGRTEASVETAGWRSSESAVVDESAESARRTSTKELAERAAVSCVLIAVLLFGASSLASADWPSFQNDSGNAGVADTPVPTENVSVSWTLRPGGTLASSPAVVDGRAYVGGFRNTSNESSGFSGLETGYPREASGYLLALAVGSGERLWRTDTDGGVWSSPAVSGETVYFGSLFGDFYALDASSGEERWSFDAGHPVFSSPAVAESESDEDVDPDEMVYFGTKKAEDYEVSGDSYPFYALDGSDGSVVWKTEVEEGVFGSPAVSGDVVYVGGQNGTLHAFDRYDGSELWSFEARGVESHRLPEARAGAVTGSPASLGDRVYFGTYSGRVYSLDASGAEIWNVSVDAAVASSPAVTDDRVYFGAYDGRLYAVDAGTGRIDWSLETDARISKSSPAVGDGVVVVGSVDGGLYAVDGDGRETWSYPTGDIVLSSPALTEKGVTFTSSDAVHQVAFDEAADGPSFPEPEEDTSEERVVLGVEDQTDDEVSGDPVWIPRPLLWAVAVLLSSYAVFSAVRSSRS